MLPSAAAVKATLLVAPNEDFHAAKFPIDPLVQQNARRERLLMKI